MKIGLITNLTNIDQFVSTKLTTANAEEWMQATGGNTGNVAFVKGVTNLLDHKVSIVNWGDNPKSVKQAYDHIVVCCANQIGAHCDLAGWVRRFSAFDLPVTFIGLGAQSDQIGNIPEIPEGSKKLLEFTKHLRINPNKTNIITRGKFSSDVIQHYNMESSPFGCPSQFISLEIELGKRCLAHQNRSSHERVITAAGNPYHPSGSLESVLTEIVEKYRGDYILQHPKLLIQLGLGEVSEFNESTKAVLERTYGRLGKFSDIASWFESYGVFFADALNWMHYSRHFTLAIGPRYHGVALPIQAGVPGKVISIDSRTHELASTTGVPVVPYQTINGMSAESLVESCKWTASDATHYDNVRRENASNYIDFLNNNKLPINPNLKKLCDA